MLQLRSVSRAIVGFLLLAAGSLLGPLPLASPAYAVNFTVTPLWTPPT